MKVLVADVLVTIGAVLGIVGSWKAYEPLGYVVAGVVLIAVAGVVAKEAR